MGVDLNDLRINREETGVSRRRFPLWIPVLLLGLGAGVGGGYLFLQGTAAAKEGVEVETAPVTVRESAAGPAPRSFTAGGWIEPAFPWPVVVSALTEERVESLRVQEGDAVEEGTIVAVLYNRDLQDEVRRAEAERERAQAALDLLEAGTRKEEIAEARAKLKELEAERGLKAKVAERSRKLCETQAVSCEQAERDEAAHQAASARVEAQQARVDLLVAGPRKEEIAAARAEVRQRASILELARKDLSYTEVKSPRKGVVYRLLVEQGERLSATKPFVVSLYDPASLWVRVDVAQADIGKVSVGQGVEIRTQAEPEKSFPGKVVRIDPRASFAKNTITVRVELGDTKGRLHPDMTARVHFHAPGAEADRTPGEPSKTLLLIPRTAVIREGGGTYVFVLADGVARRRAVELGGTLGDAVEVTGGLTPGARIIVSPLEDLADGTAVREKRSAP
ncbi:MAG: efflux RND transporter periplasmic adaptor subunit [Planctomycetota bacterium]|jgi:HlyD family secretion protein